MAMVLQSIRVLLLEDSPEDAEIIYQKLINEFDCPVDMDLTETEDEYISLIKQNPYDVILADYTLPKFNAKTALKHALVICPLTPFICVSGTIGEDVAVEMLKQGADDYVLKDRLNRLGFAIIRALESAKHKQEKEHAEEQLMKLHERNRLILDSTSDSIGMIDRDGNILNINSKFAQRLGKPVEELIGTSMKSLLPKEKYNDLYQKRMQRLHEVFDSGQISEFEDARDGKWYYNRFYPVLTDNKVVSVVLFSTDITDKKKAEEQARRHAELEKQAEMLRQKEKDYLQILDGATEGSWIMDLEAKTIEFSAVWLERLGTQNIPPSELLEYADNMIHPDDRSFVDAHRETVIKSKASKCKMEYRLKTLDKGYIWVLSQGKIIYDQNGKAQKVYGAYIDISDRKKAEQNLKETAKELESKNKLITDFFINLSHEFRTPLSVLLLAIGLMEHNLYKKEDCETTLKQLQIIKQNAYRLSRMTANLLDFTKIDAGFMKPEIELIEIISLLDSLTKSMKSFIDEQGLTLGFSSNTASLIIPCDAQFIERIMLNLISNAIKHTAKGGHIHIECHSTKKHVLISVKDNGEGIPEDKKPIIFGRFCRVNTSLARANDGCGIGLALTKALVELLGGRIWFSSTLGSGSVFFVELPIKQMLSPKQTIEKNSMDIGTRIKIEFSDIYPIES